MSLGRRMQQAAAGAGGAFYPYTVDNSVRFDETAVFYRDPSSAGNRRTFTYSTWVKKVRLFGWYSLIGQGSDGNNKTRIKFDDTYNRLFFDNEVSGTSNARFYTTRRFQDTSAWYHIVIAVDTTQATTSDRVKIYVNGVQETAFDQASYPAQNLEYWINSTQRIIYGNDYDYFGNGSGNPAAYLAETILIDGQQLTPSSFGEDKNGIWIPKSPSVTYGTNGFYTKFANSGALGTDSSGNGNNFTVSVLTSSDQMIDTPTNNFATFNALKNRTGASYPTLSEGNLKSTGVSTHAYSTFATGSSGVWYFEVYASAGTSTAGVGIRSADDFAADATTDTVYSSTGGKVVDGSSSAYGASWTTGDIIGVLVDVDSSEVTFYKNGVSQGTISNTCSNSIVQVVHGANWVLTANYGQDSSFAGVKTRQNNTDANGLGDFYYTVPTGALALCTSNLPEPTIGPNSATQSDEHFNTVLYTGTGSTNSVTGVGFQPDFVWLKARSTTYNHQAYDAVRGATKYLLPNLTSAEGTDTNALSSFNSDGFTVNTELGGNASGITFVAWNWKANGSGSSNTDGTITSTVSANTDAGISIVKFVGTANGSSTVGHGLGVAPAFIVVKPYSQADSWVCYHTSLGASGYILLDSTNAAGTSAGYWGTVGSSTFGLSAGGTNNRSGANHIAYCFAEVEGFSSFGSYTGNGSTDGPFVYTGFRPAWVMVKRSDAGTEHWVARDTKRNTYNSANSTVLYPSTNDADYTGTVVALDILSNGFKIRSTWGAQNTSGATYIYMAFAEMPFKYSVGR